jgi:hypothetical protein
VAEKGKHAELLAKKGIYYEVSSPSTSYVYSSSCILECLLTPSPRLYTHSSWCSKSWRNMNTNDYRSSCCPPSYFPLSFDILLLRAVVMDILR